MTRCSEGTGSASETHPREEGRQGRDVRRMVEQWLAEYRDAMLEVASRFEGKAIRAEDIVQEAASVAVSLSDKAVNVASPRKWLASVTRNVGLRVWRKRKRRAEHDETLLTDRPDWLGEDAMTSWLQAALLGELRNRLVEAIRCLPAAQGRVVLGMLDGLEDDEIAKMEGIKQTTVRVRRHRAVLRLREMLVAETSVFHPPTHPPTHLARILRIRNAMMELRAVVGLRPSSAAGLEVKRIVPVAATTW